MGCCQSSENAPPVVPKEEDSLLKKVTIETDCVTKGQSGVTKEKVRASKSNISIYLLRFPKIKKAYQHLFNGWCEAIQKKRPDAPNAIFGLAGPRDQVCKGLSLSGIIIADENVTRALEANKSASEELNDGILTFRDIILALCWLLVDDSKCLEKTSEESACLKYDEVMEGLRIMQSMFHQIDEDDSGEITYSELKAAFTGMGNNKIYANRMSELDFNNDKEISYPEFCVGIALWVGFVDEFNDDD